MHMRLAGIAAALLVLWMMGCSSEQKAESSSETATTSEGKEGAQEMAKAPSEEPQYATVQHILIGFEGSLPGKAVTRTKQEAHDLAHELLARAQGGEDFDALVKEYTDDAHPGIYKMANLGVPGDPAKRIYARDQMVAAFGDVGFPLAVGEIGMAEYDAQKSPYGWHIIKRVE